MAMTRRICRLADKSKRNSVDLRQYKCLILSVINEVVPNKNPIVEKEYFSTDPLTQGEAVKLGLALSALPSMARLGKKITTFRLFDGTIVEDDPQEIDQVTTKEMQNRTDDPKEEEAYGRHHRKKIPHDRRNTDPIPTCEQEKDTSIRETIS